MEESRGNQEEYTRQVLDAYRKMPGTTGTIRRSDRLLAAQLRQRGVPLPAIENALVLAAARRMIRPAGSPPLDTIRSLAYFLAYPYAQIHANSLGSERFAIPASHTPTKRPYCCGRIGGIVMGSGTP